VTLFNALFRHSPADSEKSNVNFQGVGFSAEIPDRTPSEYKPAALFLEPICSVFNLIKEKARGGTPSRNVSKWGMPKQILSEILKCFNSVP
jgi:hypothetical protein